MDEPPRGKALWTGAMPWFVAITALACLILLPGLGDAEFRPYDEGLYGKLARNALTHGRYLYAIDSEGEYFDTFSKPPLSLWLTAMSLRFYEMSLAGLRLPFALAMLGTIWVAFGWGRRLGGLPVAVGWSFAMTVCAATMRWGRHACIEPMFIGSVLLALWAYHEAYRGGAKALRWAALAGLALAFALLTKQLAIGIAVLPILVLEGWRRAGREALPRLGLAFGIPLVVGVTWFALAYAELGSPLVETLFTVGVKTRVEGFASGHNARTLNEVATVVGEAMAPWSWIVGAAGLAIMAARAVGEDRRRPDGSILLPLFFVTGVLVYENAASSMLPWYAFDLVPPLAAGLACVLAAIVAAPGTSLVDRVAMVLGWVALGLAVIGGIARFASQLDAALVGGIVLVAVLLGRRFSARAHAGVLAVAALVLVAGTRRDRELLRPSDPFAPWMPELAARGITRVALLERTGLVSHEYGTFFGSGVTIVKSQPWPTRDYDAFVFPDPMPNELVPPDGMEVLRVPGATAFVGDLDQRGFTSDTIASLLAVGPITFEAEHQPGEGDRTIVALDGTSGGLVRRHVPFRDEKTGKFTLTKGPALILPGGKYEADLELAWDCGGREGDAAIIQLVDRNQRLATKKVVCEEGTGDFGPVKVSFKLDGETKVELRLVYRTGDVAHDFSAITRL